MEKTGGGKGGGGGKGKEQGSRWLRRGRRTHEGGKGRWMRMREGDRRVQHEGLEC